ncbi:glutathione S-transferase B-like [Paramacrobiotus metropolitanus]|uniref:glutathione S-transferase B-like n=1 Tax=Paramacrobiotus metropolitanus TaxID=2943436 RepID=UPI002445D7D5|nr:glutathione S-transferase B-like [Paramacrobiotus metropolitanus]
MAPTLGYWNIRGVSAPIRYLLEYVGQPYEFKGYDLSNAQEWFGVKETLGFEFPNLPYLIDGDFKLTQGNAIIRYFARKHNLIATSEKDIIEQDVMDGVITEFLMAWVTVTYATPGKEEDLKRYRTENLTPMLQRFEKHLNNREYLVGNKLTYADFQFFERLDANIIMFPDLLKDFPNLKKFHDRIANLKGVKEFRASDRLPKSLNAGPKAKWNNV